MQKISVIIIAHNEEDYIFNCCESVYKEMDHYKYPYEVIVVDNNSTDFTNHNAQAAGVNIIAFEERPGIPFARQKGFEISSGDILVFLDADAEMPWGWIQTCLESLEPEDVVAVSGALQFYDGSEYLNYYARQFYKMAKMLHPMWPTLQGGNYAIKRWALEKIGGFDTSYIFWGEDTRTAVQLSMIGRIILNPRMVINTSARRLKQDGVFKTVFHYIINYFSTNIFNSPVSKKYKNFR